MSPHDPAPEQQSKAGYYRLIDTTDAGGRTVETFVSNEQVSGPWGATVQHGGPVAGLLVRAMERCEPRPETRISRVSVDLLGPVPVDEVRVTARIERPGRRIELLSATLDARGPDRHWRPAACARAWRLATQPTDDIVRHADPSIGAPPAPGEELRGFTAPESWTPGGFVQSVTWHAASDGWTPGEPSVAWIRLELPLVEGEETSELQNVLIIADVANGVGARLDPAAFSFLNTDLDVSLYQPPRGPWIGLRAETSIGGDGVGQGSAVLYDSAGPLGRATQNLLVERHRSPEG